MLHHFDTDD